MSLRQVHHVHREVVEVLDLEADAHLEHLQKDQSQNLIKKFFLFDV
jgi:hypothetical protein